MPTTTELTATTVDYFESIYAQADGDPHRIPWSDPRPSPALVNWFNDVAPALIRCGARVAVVGCGLGDDAREVIRRGYEVTAFDCSATAVRWANRLDPDHVDCYRQADLFDPPARWRRRFDLVVEVYNIESLTPDLRNRTVAALADLMTPHGRLLLICRGADDPVALHDGPPWPLTENELREATALAGLVPDGPVSAFSDDEDPSVQCIRAVFARA